MPYGSPDKLCPLFFPFAGQMQLCQGRSAIAMRSIYPSKIQIVSLLTACSLQGVP